MSGSTGGSRITKNECLPFLEKYTKEVLSKWDKWDNKVALTGSLVAGVKKDYGDLDIVILVKGSDKKELKKEFCNFLNSLPLEEVLYFKNPKYLNKRFLNTGEIVTLLYNKNNVDYSQIDNIFALSELEFDFKQNFLNITAEVQGLLLGLIKIIILEKGLNYIKETIDFEYEFNSNFEYEFNLSSVELQLREIELDENFKTINSKILWNSQNWEFVESLLKDFNLEESFENLIEDVKNNIKLERSFKRLVGVFKSMVSVKSGEENTEKGFNKIKAIERVNSLLV